MEFLEFDLHKLVEFDSEDEAMTYDAVAVIIQFWRSWTRDSSIVFWVQQ